ncbi:hypothetical protein O9993_13495 [Vibrio lentus]|nr:hypothetical protein [Vibrio lentus]
MKTAVDAMECVGQQRRYLGLVDTRSLRHTTRIRWHHQQTRYRLHHRSDVVQVFSIVPKATRLGYRCRSPILGERFVMCFF